MNSMDVRRLFFDFFKKSDHSSCEEFPLSFLRRILPLLFANAGMNQFKDFWENRRRTNVAVSIQKCIRAGGKHNDFEEVGRTKRHLTFLK